MEQIPEDVHWKIHEQTDRAANRLRECVVCILGFIKHERPSGIGTGVLLSIPPYFFLVTAAHVITDGPRDLYVEIDGKALPIVEKFVLFEKSPDKSWEPDIAFAGLSALTVNALGIERFLPPGALGASGGVRGRYALILGYPASQARSNPHAGNIVPALLSYSTKVLSDDQVSRIGKDPEMQFAIEFDQDMSVKQERLTSAPKPIGLSGSPIFGLNSMLGESVSDPLVGIATTWRRDDPKCLIATDLSFVVAAILQTFPECKWILQPPSERPSLPLRLLRYLTRVFRLSSP